MDNKNYQLTQEIYSLCPILKSLNDHEITDALGRMNYAHALNGGEYIGFLETAKAYLQGVGYVYVRKIKQTMNSSAENTVINKTWGGGTAWQPDNELNKSC